MGRVVGGSFFGLSALSFGVGAECSDYYEIVTPYLVFILVPDPLFSDIKKLASLIPNWVLPRKTSYPTP